MIRPTTKQEVPEEVERVVQEQQKHYLGAVAARATAARARTAAARAVAARAGPTAAGAAAVTKIAAKNQAACPRTMPLYPRAKSRPCAPSLF